MEQFSNLFKIFLVLPQILPFDFGSNQINMDDMVTVTCVMVKGDTPVEINWSVIDAFGNHKKLSTNDGIVITKTNQRVSVLTIESVQARHRGNYSCTINKGGQAFHNAYLAINGDYVPTL